MIDWALARHHMYRASNKHPVCMVVGHNLGSRRVIVHHSKSGFKPTFLPFCLLPCPPPCSDISRGSQLYETPHYEAGVVSSFLPVPLCGAAGTGQVSTVNGCGALYEQTSVVGVWRVLPQPDAGSSSSGNSSSSDGSKVEGAEDQMERKA
jgi:hypothetical protein